MRDRCVVNTSGLARRIESVTFRLEQALTMRCLLSAPELTSSRVANAAGGGGGSHPGSSRCHLSRRPPSYPPRRSQPSRPRLVRHDRRGTVSALGAELSPACRAGIALVVTLRGTLAVDTHDGPL